MQRWQGGIGQIPRMKTGEVALYRTYNLPYRDYVNHMFVAYYQEWRDKDQLPVFLVHAVLMGAGFLLTASQRLAMVKKNPWILVMMKQPGLKTVEMILE